MRAAIYNFFIQTHTNRLGITHTDYRMVIFTLFVGSIMLAGLLALLDSLSAYLRPVDMYGRRRGLFSSLKIDVSWLGKLVSPANWLLLFRQFIGLMSPDDWKIFFRNLIGLYIVEALITACIDWRVPEFREWYAYNWHWLWMTCLFFSPLALVGRIEDIRTGEYLDYLNAQREKAEKLLSSPEKPQVY